MNEMQKEILEEVRSNIEDMEAHSYNNYKDDDERHLTLTVKQIYALEKLLSE